MKQTLWILGGKHPGKNGQPVQRIWEVALQVHLRYHHKENGVDGVEGGNG